MLSGVSLMGVMLFILSVLFVMICVMFLIPKWRLSYISKKPFPAEWESILQKNLSIYLRLPSGLKQKLRQQIKLFLAKKKFYGCAGLEITEEIRVTIAAEACILTLKRPTSRYNTLQSILVYPGAFRKSNDLVRDMGVETKKNVDLLGESWPNGKVILSWDNVEKDAIDTVGGHNVALHEFAHQLDFEGGAAGNGAPELIGRGSYQRWAQVFSNAYVSLCQEKSADLKEVLDKYGTSNPAEFFAVATEAFYERPQALQQQHPELYQQLQKYYRVNPIEWYLK